MSATNRSAQEVLASIPGWSKRSADLMELSGGLSNRSYLVTSGGRRFVLRLSARDHLEFRDHDIELRVQQMAAARNLAAPVAYADPSSGVMLSEFIPGRSLRDADVRRPRLLADIAVLLRSVHQLPRTGRRFTPHLAVRRYVDALTAGGVVDPLVARCIELVDALPESTHFNCCHNDIIAANIISGDGLRLIDWEYASDNDPYFDLASLTGWHELDTRYADTLLGEYAGSNAPEYRERLDLQQRAYTIVQWLWIAHWQMLNPRERLGDRLERVRKRLDN